MPRKIAIVGFADSKRDAPWLDPSWEKWTVNDLYFHVGPWVGLPQGQFPPGSISRVFEVHHLLGMGNRRNPTHEPWMKEIAPQLNIPIYMQEKREEFPSSVGVPRMELIECFGDEGFGGRAGCDYITNSISWMIALALFETSEWTELPDGRRIRLCEKGTEIGLWGVDMAADTEFGSQRPSCEFWLGVGKSMGVPLYIPDDSELLKAPALYGFDTSHPMRVRWQSQLQSCKEQTIQIQQQIAAHQQQTAMLEAQLHMLRGRKSTIKDNIRNWTMPTDISVGQEVEMAPHHQPIMQLADGTAITQIGVSPSDNQVNVMEEING